MAKQQRTRTRIKSRIDELPEELRDLIDKRLTDTRVTYIEIAEEISQKGYLISKSSVGRYALRQGCVLNRLKEAQEQTRVLMNAVKTNPDVDYTEAGMQILMDQLIKKMATAQEEIDEMAPDKAGRLMVAISRTAAYKEKLKSDLSRSYKKAIEKVKAELRKELANEPELLVKMAELANRVEEKIAQELEGESNG
jgi:hypothetical protein